MRRILVAAICALLGSGAIFAAEPTVEISIDRVLGMSLELERELAQLRESSTVDVTPVARDRVASDISLEDLLYREWSLRPSRTDLQGEFERMERETLFPRVLARLSEEDFDAFVQVVVKPSWIRRTIARLYSEMPHSSDARLGEWIDSRVRHRDLPATVSVPQLDGRRRKSPESTDSVTCGSWRPSGLWQGPIASPASRQDLGPRALWTGDELFVWGDSAAPMLYDPSSQTWRFGRSAQVNLFSSPPSVGASLGLVGDELVVRGGETGQNRFGVGFTYSISTDASRRHALLGGPYNRNVAATGGEILMYGGSVMTHESWCDVTCENWVDSFNQCDNDPCQRCFESIRSNGESFDPITGETTSLPSRTQPHQDGATSTWTGSEFLLWGGVDAATGEAFNPSTDSWRDLPTAFAPTPRRLAGSGWNGDEWFVWGGRSSGVYDQTGSVYSSQTDSWRLSASGGLTGRSRPGIVWDGTRFIVWGGHSQTPLRDGKAYDPASDTWSDISNTNVPLSSMFGTEGFWTGSRALFWSGDNGGLYDPATDTWDPIATTSPGAPPATTASAVVSTGAELITWGGSPEIAARFDYLTATWGPISTTNDPVTSLEVVAVWTGTEMLVWGGAGGRYDPTTDSWTPMSTLDEPASVGLRRAVWSGDRMLVWVDPYAPGIDDGVGGSYDPDTDSWSSIPNAVGHCVDFVGLTWAGSEMFCDAGGTTDSIFNPTTGLWRFTSNASNLETLGDWVYTGTDVLSWSGSDVQGYDLSSDTRTIYDFVDGVSDGKPLSLWTGNQLLMFGGITNQPWGTCPYRSSTYYAKGWSRDVGAEISDRGSIPLQDPSHAFMVGDEALVWEERLARGALLSPGQVQAEIPCDGIDQACNGDDDEGGDSDGDGFDECAPGDPFDADGLAPDCNDDSSETWALGDVEQLTVEPGVVVFDVLLNWADMSLVWGEGRYAVARGFLSELRANGDFSGNTWCVDSDVDYSEVPYLENNVPRPAGDGYYYLIRGKNDCGTGTWGNELRDQTFAACGP